MHYISKSVTNVLEKFAYSKKVCPAYVSCSIQTAFPVVFTLGVVELPEADCRFQGSRRMVGMLLKESKRPSSGFGKACTSVEDECEAVKGWEESRVSTASASERGRGVMLPENVLVRIQSSRRPVGVFMKPKEGSRWSPALFGETIKLASESTKNLAIS